MPAASKVNKTAQPFKNPKGGVNVKHGSHGHKGMPGKKQCC